MLPWGSKRGAWPWVPTMGLSLVLQSKWYACFLVETYKFIFQRLKLLCNMQRKQQCWVVDNSYIDATTSRQGCTPYGATNSYLATLTTNALGKKMILGTQCHSNINKPPNCDVQFTKHIWNSMLQPNLCMSNCCIFLTLECTSNQKTRDSVLASLWGTSLLNRTLLGCDARSHWRF